MKKLKLAILAAAYFLSNGLMASSSGQKNINTAHYKILFQENSELCGYADKKINHYLNAHGSIQIDFEGGINGFNNSVFNFPKKWKFTKSDATHPPFPFYYFDINNDGEDEAVVLLISSGDILNYSVHVFNKDDVSEKSLINSNFVSDWQHKKSIGAIELFSAFRLDKISDRPEKGSIEASIDSYFAVQGLQDTQFFEYGGNFYFVLTDNNKKFIKYRVHNKYSSAREFLVVGKYLGGFIDSVSRMDQDSVVQPMCYFELIK